MDVKKDVHELVNQSTSVKEARKAHFTEAYPN